MQIIESLSQAGAPEESIQELEHKLGCRLPEDYRRFLAQINGGRPTPSRFNIQQPEGTTRSAVSWFFTIDPLERLYTIDSYIETYEGRIPDGVVPIACDSFGNLLLLDLRESEFGHIHFWDHENESEEDPYWTNVYFVGNSFSELIESLR